MDKLVGSASVTQVNSGQKVASRVRWPAKSPPSWYLESVKPSLIRRYLVLTLVGIVRRLPGVSPCGILFNSSATSETARLHRWIA